MNFYGLIGRSLDHSFSKDYFTEKFQKESVAGTVYKNFELSDIKEIINLIKSNPKLKGLNVTIPFKTSVIPFLDDIDTVAEKIGAVNTIQIQIDGSTKGFNTDYIGFRNSLSSFVDKKNIKALILGTGGASKAVAFALQKMKIPYLFVSREPIAAESIGYSDLNIDILKNYHLIVNCTPLGTFPEVSQFPPIPFELLTPEHFLFDLIYNPEETVFLNKGKKSGAKTKNGREMLIFQAEASWNIWNS